MPIFLTLCEVFDNVGDIWLHVDHILQDHFFFLLQGTGCDSFLCHQLPLSVNMRLVGDGSARSWKVTDWLHLVYPLVEIRAEWFILNVLNLYVDKLRPLLFFRCCHSCVSKLDRIVGLVFYLELARLRQILQVEFDRAVSFGLIKSCLCGLWQLKLTRCNMTLVIVWPDIDSGVVVLDTTILKAIVSGVSALLDLHYILSAWLHLQRGYWIGVEPNMLIDLICMRCDTCLSSVRRVVVITLSYVHIEIEIFRHGW